MTEAEVADVKKMLLEEQLNDMAAAAAAQAAASSSSPAAGEEEEPTFTENAQLDYDDIIVGSQPVELSGGFLPIEGPVQPVSDQLLAS